VKPAKSKKKGGARTFEDVQWLNDVREVRHPLDANHPIFVREVTVASGERTPQPTVPFPERHPFCEFNITLKGLTTQFICGEKVERQEGDVMLLGPGVPHYVFRHSYPHRTITVYFLPLVLFEMGPRGDGAWLLSRFTVAQAIGERAVRPSPKLRRALSGQMQAIAREFQEQKAGSELRLWGMLVETLVDFLRWEVAAGKWVVAESRPQDWAHLEKALRYLHERYAEPLYIEQIAAAIGITANRLRDLFRKTLGMSCSHYLQSLRIAQAKVRLCAPDAQVTDIALNVGFETLSHFNTSFRKLTGMSPTQYIRTLPR